MTDPCPYVYLYECPYGHQTEAGQPRTTCQHAGCGSTLRRIRADGTRWPDKDKT